LDVKIRYGLIALALIAALFGEGGTLAFRLDPSLAWRVLETEHFSIVFPEGLEALAERSAQIAERAHKFWSEELEYSPEGKTTIVLADQSDLSRVLTSIFPHNVILLDHPWSAEYLGASYGLEQLIYSEYGRIVSATRLDGFASDLYALLGKLVSPGLLEPLWLREGLSEYPARDRSLMEMVVRAMAERGFPTLAQLSTPHERWSWPPAKLQARAIGVLLLQYLQETYGEGVLYKLSRAHVERPIASAAIGALKLVTGRSPQEIYHNFQLWAKERLQAGAQGGIKSEKRLSRVGFWSLFPSWSPDGTEIVYKHMGPGRLAGLRIVGRDGSGDRPIIYCECGPPAWLDEHTLIYPKLGLWGRFQSFYDLYSYDLISLKEERLTYGERIYLVEPFPDGRRLLVMRSERGMRSSLIIFDYITRSRQILKEFGPEAHVQSLALSPDGSKIALSIWMDGEGQDVYLLESEGGGLIRLTSDPALDLDPSFSKDGEFVLFSSDRSGSFELYAYHLPGGRLFRVSSGPLGGFAPKVSPGGEELAFVGYGPEGFSIYSTEYDPAHWQPISSLSHIEAAESPPEAPSPELKPYDPAPALLPTFWLPLLTPGHIGLFTRSEDPLRQHRYSLTLGLSLETLEPLYKLDYTNAQLFPLIHIGLEVSPKGQRQRLALEFPFMMGLSSERTLAAGIEQEPGKTEIFLQGRLTDFGGLDLFQRRSTLFVAGALIFSAEGLKRRLAVKWEELLKLPLESGIGPHNLRLHASSAWSDLEEFRLGLRGYEDRLQGRQLLLAGIQYSFPIWAIEWGCCRSSPWPIFFDDLRGGLFLDFGTAGSQLELGRLRASLGAELKLKVIVGYGLAEGWIRLGLAYAFEAQDLKIYLDLESGSI